MSEVVGQKEDSTFDLLTLLEVNKKPIIGGLVAIVVAVAGTIVWRSLRQSRVENSSGALLAVTTAHKQGLPLAELEKVIQDHGGTAAAAQASLLAGRELFQQGKYADARNRFEAAASGAGSDDISAAAQFGLAACLDAEGKTAEAITAYQRVTDFPGGKHLGSLARLTIARIQESQGKSKEALAMYDAILRTPTSATAMEASQLRSALLRQHPELTPVVTNTTTVITPVLPN